jgi:beta-glucosidase-like glycosyl hydrolase
MCVKCGNEMSQNEVLRAEWGFDGYIVSDCGAVVEPEFTYWVNHTLGKNASVQVLLGLTGGCDLGCVRAHGLLLHLCAGSGLPGPACLLVDSLCPMSAFFQMW